MRILLKFTLDCEPEAAWNALRSPAIMNAVAAPFAVFESLEPDGFPDRWGAGEHPVLMKAFGIAAVGEQIIDISYLENRGGERRRERGPERDSKQEGNVRLVRDSGRGVSGALLIVTSWEHTMAVSRAPGGRTLYRDQLKFEAGPFTALAWPFYWAFWQWRGRGIRRLSSGWHA